MLALLFSAGSAFVSPACSMVRHSSAVHAAPAAMMAKGFGKEPEKVAPKPASEGKKKRDAASAKLDKLKATGNPEYMVSIRTVGGETSEWMPVGGLAVPRSNSVDTAVSMAIFNNEDELLKGAFRAFPKLKSSTDKFEYGYRLREFPDDEVKIAQKDAAKESTNPFMQWFNQLDSPLNDGK
uniref:Photosystem II reaction center Psb28 protein n=1 Tax=Phaeocystis antarctica TaxID=33657 RepID=A0A7S0EVK7_9EUKA